MTTPPSVDEIMARAIGKTQNSADAIYRSTKPMSLSCAQAVRAALEAAGYCIVPKTPSVDMLEAGGDAIALAYAANPEWEEAKDMAENLLPDGIYTAMVNAVGGTDGR